MLKNKFIRIIFGEMCLLIAMTLLILAVNLIPGKLAIENLSSSQTTFKRLAEVKNYNSIFTAVRDNLNRVDVMFKNPNLESRDELIVSLTDQNGNRIASQNFSGFNLGDTSYARMDFNAVTDSSGKIYNLNIIPTKILDGKLQFGVKDNKSYFIQYYGNKISFNGSLKNTETIFKEIISREVIVLILPIIFLGIYLW